MKDGGDKGKSKNKSFLKFLSRPKIQIRRPSFTSQSKSNNVIEDISFRDSRCIGPDSKVAMSRLARNNIGRSNSNMLSVNRFQSNGAPLSDREIQGGSGDKLRNSGSWFGAARPSIKQLSTKKKSVRKTKLLKQARYGSGSLASENKDAFLVDSVTWFGRHVPDCVLSALTSQEHNGEEEEENLIHSGPYGRESIPMATLELEISDVGDDSISDASPHDLGHGSLASAASSENDALTFLPSDSIKFAQSFKSQRKEAPKNFDLPYATKHYSALLFVDISGFTKLSTLLDVEKLSKVINSYFQMIVNAITDDFGDILKFAGDAVFAEWRVPLPLSHLDDPDKTEHFGKQIQKAVVDACQCAAKIVETCSDFPVFKNVGVTNEGEQVASLNVHCGVGVGKLAGVHVGDEKRRREYLILGDPIDQVARAEGVANHGEVYASPEIIEVLEDIVEFKSSVISGDPDEPALIASRKQLFYRLPLVRKLSESSISTAGSVKYFDRLSARCEGLNTNTLLSIRKKISLYLHPVTRDDEMNAAHHPTSKRKTEERHRAEAELRKVYVIFVNAEIDAKISEDESENDEMYEKLNQIINTVSEVLEEFRGHMRQFIVDDKGVVLIATFGLRGSTFPNLVKEKALPATLAIHEELLQSCGVNNRVGATFGKAYCGVIGGIRRHEYAVLGPTVNLAARLMANPSNPGVLVDNNVQHEAGDGYEFTALPPVKAKGYADPVPIYEPRGAVERRWLKAEKGFVGRKNEMMTILETAKAIMFSPRGAQMFLVTGESGLGKSSVVSQAVERLKKLGSMKRKRVIVTKKVAKEVEKLAPFSDLDIRSTFRTVFLDALRQVEAQLRDGSGSDLDVSQHSFFKQHGMSNSLHGLTTSRHGLSNSQHQNRRVSAWVAHLANAEDLSLSSYEGSSVNTFAMSPYECLRMVCQVTDQDMNLAALVAKYFLELAVDETNLTKKLPPMKTIIDFMVDIFLECVKGSCLVVIALDDVHFMDALSWKALRCIFERSNNVMIVCTSRPLKTNKLSIENEFWTLLSECEKNDDLYMSGKAFQRIDLQPFSRKQVGHLVASLAEVEDDEVDDSMVTFVYQQSGGMPHFAREILEAINLTNLLGKRESSERLGWNFNLSSEQLSDKTNAFSSLEQMMMHRIDLLDRDMRTTVQICAMLGREFLMSDLVLVQRDCLGIQKASDDFDFSKKFLDKAVSDRILEVTIDEDVEHQEELNGMELDGGSDFHEDSLYRFRLDVFRTSVLYSMLESRRRDLHSIIAKALQRQQKEKFGDNFTDYRGMLKLFGHLKACADSVSAAELALKIGKEFENLGLSSQSLSLYKETIEIWDLDVHKDDDPDRTTIGGIESQVVYAIGPTDLEYLIKIKIETGKCFANVHDGTKSALTYQDAYSILKEAPSSEDIEDHAMLFPIFSGLCLALKWGRIHDDAEKTYEQELVARFVLEANRHGDPIHEARALAMQGVMFYSLGKLNDCLETQRKLNEVYDVNEHSTGICKSYGSDRAAQNYGLCCEWHELLGNQNEMTETVEFVLNTLLPKMEERNVHNQFMMLYPVLMVMKGQGMANRALRIFEAHVVKMFEQHYGSNASTFCLAMYKPTVFLLELLSAREEGVEISNKQLQKILNWVIDEKAGEFTRDLESVTLNLGRDGTGVVAEICLLLLKNTAACALISEVVRESIILKGTNLAKASVSKSKDKEGFRYAYKEVKNVLKELQSMS